MLSDSWNGSDNSSSIGISKRVFGKIKPDEPLRNKIDVAQGKLQSQINRLNVIDEKLKKKHDMIFSKIVTAKRNNKPGYARVYAGELSQVRKMKDMVGGAKLSMEQVKIRLETVSELGDVVVTLSPCMSIIRGLSPSLSGLVPEASSSMQDLSQMLGEMMSNSSVGAIDTTQQQLDMAESTPGVNAIMEEAHNAIVGQTKTILPDVPDMLKDADIPQERNQSWVGASVVGVNSNNGQSMSVTPEVPEILKESRAIKMESSTQKNHVMI